MIDMVFMQKVMNFCQLYPCSLVSGWRTTQRNKLKGGAKASKHLTGEAVDLVYDTVAELHQAAQAALQMQFDGVELDLDNNHLHLDQRDVSWHVVCKHKKTSDLQQYLTTYQGRVTV